MKDKVVVKRIVIALVVMGALAVFLDLMTKHGSTPRHRIDAPLPAASSPTLALLGGLSVGTSLGPYEIQSISEPVDGAIWVQASTKVMTVTYEIRLAGDSPNPAARAGRYAVYFRTTDAGGDIMTGAVALGHLLERAPKDAPAPLGLTPYPPP
jgi:hypothetical protein